MSLKHYVVNNICPVIRCYSKSDINKFGKLLNKAIKLNINTFIFVMDKGFGNDEDLKKAEALLTEMIENSFKEIIKNKKIDLILLKSKTHVNGTGAFNIVFNYIRNNEKYKNYLFHFCDDDDIYNDNEFNNLINIIINNKYVISKYEADNYININLIKHEEMKDDKIICDNVLFETTRREKEIIENVKNNNKCVFYNDDILFTGTKSKTHLLNGVNNGDCNLWNFLFNPYYYDQLTCRLLLFGREDLDIINYLMLCENDTIITNMYRDKKDDIYKENGEYRKNIYDLIISNKLIRLNSVLSLKFTKKNENIKIVNNAFNIYNHQTASISSDYNNHKDIYNLPLSITEYHNNHLNKDYNNNIDNLNDDSVIFKNKIKAPLANDKNNFDRKFFYGLFDNYINGRDFLNIDKTDSAEYGIKMFNLKNAPNKTEKFINKKENTFGEYYIVSYDVYKLKKNFKFDFTLNNLMFNNGKNINDKYINDNDVREIMFYTINEKTKYKNLIEIINNYHKNDKNFINWIVEKIGFEYWNEIYFKYKQETLNNYPLEDVPTHAFGGNEKNDSDYKQEILILKISLIVLIILVFVLIMIIIIIKTNLKLKTNEIYNNSI